MASGFGAKVQIKVDKSCKAQFNADIQSMVNQIKISNKFVVLQKDMNRVTKEAQAAINKKNITIKVSEIDCSTAISGVKSQLEKMLSSLSVSNGVNITGLKDFMGADGIDDAQKQTTAALNKQMAAINQAKGSVASYAGELKNLQALSKSISSSMSKALKTGDLSGEEEEIAAINQKIREWNAAYSELVAKQKSVSAEERAAASESVAALESEGVAIQNTINKLQERLTIHSQEAAAAKANAAATSEEAAAAAAFDGQLKSLMTTISSLDKVFKSAISGSSMLDDETRIRSLTEEYRQLKVAAESAKVTQDSGEVVKLQEQAVALQRVITGLQQEQKATSDAAAAAERESAAKQKAAAAQAKRNAQLNSEEALQKRILALQVQINNALKRYSAASGSTEYGNLKELKQTVDALSLGTSKIDASGLNKIENEAKNYISTIRAAGNDTLSFGDRLKNAFSKFSGWFGVSQIVMQAVQGFRSMITNVIELDTAMTELRKVTNETDAAYSSFFSQATSRAKELGATVADTITATADMARTGKYTLDQASDLADAALVYKNVGDSIQNVSDASASIISTMQAFHIAAEEAINIVDKFNEVGNNFAIGSDGIGEALTRSASAMSAAGNTLDETIALITAANTVVQNPETVGTTMKTVSMYLRAAKTEAEEAGESTEGMAESVSKLREELLALTGNKVDIMVDDNTFKSTYQIFKELSAVWSSLTDTTQANITQLIGGKRNANVTSAILENFSIAESALATSSNAVGSALAENEKYLDSIEGKIAEFKATFETLSSDLISSDFVKGIVAGGTAALEILDKIVSTLGTFPTLIAGLGIGGIVANLD